MLSMHYLFALAALYILFVKGQAPPVVVEVGVQGSFYSPATISAGQNATITFEFFGDVHTVTQSSFEDPCAPLPGGFHSGFAGMGLNTSAPVLVWNLVVTNVTAPIWYFCAVTSPTFHCTVGMVGVINPPSQAMFSQFSSAAKLITTTPTINPTPTLIGQGAFASITPTPSPLSATPSFSLRTTSALAPTSTSITTSTPSPTNTPVPSTTSHLGAIVGGAVGGSIAFIGLVVVLLWFFFLRKKSAPKSPHSDDFSQYDSAPVHRPNDGFTQVQRTENLYPDHSVMSTSSISSARLAPVRRPSGPVLLQPPYTYQQESAQSDLASSSSNINSPEQPSNVDIRALAQEVAAVLYQDPSAPSRHTNSSQDLRGQQQQLMVQNQNDLDYPSHAADQPPPNYRAATGSSTTFSGKASHT